MNIVEIEGDVFAKAASLSTPALAHGVNCQGVMGAGVAKGVRARWPKAYQWYKEMCDEWFFNTGDCQPIYVPFYGVTDSDTKDGWLFNLATQFWPGADANVDYIAAAVRNMVFWANSVGITEIATVRLGCGIGGLQWSEVKKVLKEIEWPNGTLYVCRPEGDRVVVRSSGGWEMVGCVCHNNPPINATIQGLS